MTKKDIINELKLDLDRKRNLAQIMADDYVAKLCEDPMFKQLYTSYNQAKIDLIKAQYSKDSETYSRASIKFKIARDSYEHYVSINNIDTRKMEPMYGCTKCNDTGVVNGKMCDCVRQELNKRLNELNSQYKYATFKDCSPNIDETLKLYYDKCSLWCEKYPDSKILNITMSGGTGTGKTFLLECMASRLMERGFNVMFVNAFTLNEECRRYHFSLPSKVNEYMDCDVLIIDDLGTEPLLKNITIEYLFNIINTRQRRYKPTLISTNLSMENILNRYDERIFSRLSNKMITLNLPFKGIDMRKKY